MGSCKGSGHRKGTIEVPGKLVYKGCLKGSTKVPVRVRKKLLLRALQS